MENMKSVLCLEHDREPDKRKRINEKRQLTQLSIVQRHKM